jgi:hypothetical protein
LGTLALLYVPLLAWVAVVATPAYGALPAFSMFLPPVALASLALALFMRESTSRFVACIALAVLAAWLAENIFSIVRHEIGWAERQGADGASAVAAGLRQSLSRAPYWLAAALPLALAGWMARLRT